MEAVESVDELPIKKVVPHTLRHAFASHAVDGDCDIVVLKAILGHAYLKTTEMYVHPSIETQRVAMQNHPAHEKLTKCLYSLRRKVRIHRGKHKLA